MRLLSFWFILMLALTSCSGNPEPEPATSATPPKTCPVTKLSNSIYKFTCPRGEFFPVELAEFLEEHPALAVQSVSPLINYNIAIGYVVVTRNK